MDEGFVPCTDRHGRLQKSCFPNAGSRPPSGTHIVSFSTPTFSLPLGGSDAPLGIYIVSDDSTWLLATDLGNPLVVVEHMVFCSLGR